MDRVHVRGKGRGWGGAGGYGRDIGEDGREGKTERNKEGCGKK